MNKTKWKQTHRNRQQTGGCQRGVGGVGEWLRGLRGLRGTKLQLYNKSRGWNIQHKEYGQQYCNNFVWGQTVTRLTVVIIS